MMRTLQRPRCEPCRHRRGHFYIADLPQRADHFKHRLHFWLERLGGQWVHRYQSYVFADSKRERVERFIKRYGGAV